AIVQSSSDLRNSQCRRASGGELDCQRDSIEPSTDCSNCRKVFKIGRKIPIQGSGSGDEELRSTVSEDVVQRFLTVRRHIQGGHAIDVLARDSQALSARRKNERVWTSAHDRIRQLGRGVDEVLAVIKNKQEFLSTYGTSNGFGRTRV